MIPDRDGEQLKKEINSIAPNIDVFIWPEVERKDDVLFAITWKHPHGELSQFKNLKVIMSYGAGVDHILSDTSIKDDVTVTRFVDPSLSQEMSEFVSAVILRHHLRLDQYEQQQQDKIWRPYGKRITSNTTIGILGLGELGQHLATTFYNLGMQVRGLSRDLKKIKGVTSFTRDNIDEFLSETQYLVCALPLTDETKNILNKDLFNKLPKGAYLVNVGRGEHLNEEDLIEAVNSRQLDGAYLDVFSVEPLPQESPLWTTSRISLSPHIAAITSPRKIAENAIENYQRIHTYNTFNNTVNRKKGY